MKFKSTLTSLAISVLFQANAAEPLCWERTPNRPAPAQFDTFHGEALDFRCTFIGFGAMPFAGSGDSSPRLYYQTNGMASAWWDIPATVSTTVVTNCQPPITNYSLSAVFPPAADPGAERLTVFFGAPSNAYAAAQVRFRNSPGATPNVIPPPSVLDWLSQLISATNALSIDLLAELSAATSTVTTALQAEITSATNSLSTSFAPTITNTVTKSYVESLGIESGISAATATNIANTATNFLTRSEAEAGYTEWKFDPPYDVPSESNNWTTLIDVVFIDEENPYWAVTWGFRNPGEHWLTLSCTIDDSIDAVHLSYIELPASVSRHRITPTALSQLTNDVGYVTSTITNSLASTTYVDSATNALLSSACSYTDTATNSLSTSFAPTITNTVTKSYVESLGISSGLTTNDVCNIVDDMITTQRLLREWYPDGSVTNVSQWAAMWDGTNGLKYAFNTNDNTAAVLPFCVTADDNDNSHMVGRVVIPPYVETNGVRYAVTAIGSDDSFDWQFRTTAIVAPTTVTSIGENAFYGCTSLTSVSLPAATSIGEFAFGSCTSLASVSLPAATSIWKSAFYGCTSLASVSLPAATSIGEFAFDNCTSLASVDFGSTARSSIPPLGEDAFYNVPTNCVIVIPDGNYNAWTAASGWSDLVQQGYRFLRHSEWEYARRYELPKKISDLTNDVGLVTSTITNGLVTAATATNIAISASASATNTLNTTLSAEISSATNNLLYHLRYDRMYRVVLSNATSSVTFIGRIQSNSNDYIYLYGTLSETSGGAGTAWSNFMGNYLFGCEISFSFGTFAYASLYFSDAFSIVENEIPDVHMMDFQYMTMSPIDF